MDSLKSLTANRKIRRPKDPHLHSGAHVLADELANAFNDRKHFGFYLKLAVTHPPQILRKIAGDVLENKNAKTPGKLFAYLIKKYNQEAKERIEQSKPHDTANN